MSSQHVPNLLEIEDDFWASRDHLATIKDAALLKMAAPWATFAGVTARVLANVPPDVYLPGIVGGRGSLNWLAAIAVRSGGGKGAANAVAKSLVPPDPLFGFGDERPMGSGEGLSDAFWKRDPSAEGGLSRVPSAFIEIDEIDDYETLVRQRGGSTFGTQLRKAFSGGVLGYGNRKTRDSLPPVAAHTYRLTLTMAVQLARAGVLLNDGGGGTMQRFAWFPASDPRKEVVGITSPTARLALPVPKWGGHTEIKVPEHIWREIQAAQVAELDDADTHAMYRREKLAAALAIMDGRTHIDDEDWRLSGIAAAVSDATRDWVTSGLADAEREEDRQKGARGGVRQAASDMHRAVEHEQAVEKTAAWAQGRLEQAWSAGMNRKDLWCATSNPHRRANLDTALDKLVADELAVAAATESGGTRWFAKGALG